MIELRSPLARLAVSARALGLLGLMGAAVGLAIGMLCIAGSLDPFFTANVFLTIPNLGGLEVEEAYAMTTALPAGLQLKAGVFRSAAGRQNEQHLHMQDFSLRPLLNRLGEVPGQ